MSLNIKNERIHELVRELAALTGATQTGAVEEAVRRRLEELHATAGRRARPAPKYSQEEIQRRITAMERSAEEFRSLTTAEQRRGMVEHEDWLYDEGGLPK
ncbi:Rv0623-like transcription factor [Agrococcus baldri]|uniref:Rv0623-like transcription factor n=1 Tax=Agrococcus baldri TaxID=153730 RepID=A0AA94HM63_9MICO|nr:type II toxin-antitoxin system VapB family antitoxin [Agrococcus baldri]SFS09804.1 Rv0623-like transcription factor [Agrococcus baldri]